MPQSVRQRAASTSPLGCAAEVEIMGRCIEANNIPTHDVWPNRLLPFWYSEAADVRFNNQGNRFFPYVQHVGNGQPACVDPSATTHMSREQPHARIDKKRSTVATTVVMLVGTRRGGGGRGQKEGGSTQHAVCRELSPGKERREEEIKQKKRQRA